MKFPTASSLKRTVMCPGSALLPQAPSTGEDAIRGTENHDAVEVALDGGAWVELPDCVRELAEGSASFITEPAFALDVIRQKVRFLGTKIKRNYGDLGVNEVALSTDAIFLMNDGRIVVADWKSRSRVDAAEKNLQLAAAACAVMAWRDIGVVHVAIGYLDDGELDIARFDVIDQHAFYKQMRNMVDALRKGDPKVHAGPWCSYCPAMVHCPAQAKPLAVFMGEMQSFDERIPAMTLDQVGKAYEAVQAASKFLEKVEKSIKLRAERERIPLGNGMVLGITEAKRTSLDGKAAVARLNELGEKTDQYSKTTFYSTLKQFKAK